MKPTCDLCPREATYWREPGDVARCGLPEHAPGQDQAPLTRRPPPPSGASRGSIDRAQLVTVVPPADERCPRCSRILIAAPCGCLSAAQRWVALQQEADALWRAMSSAEHVEAVRLKAAARGREQERAPCT